jgi:hypothetical protein
MTVVRSKFLLAEGVLHNQDGVTHVQAKRLTPLTDTQWICARMTFIESWVVVHWHQMR